MPLRMIEISAPADAARRVADLAAAKPGVSSWRVSEGEGGTILHLVLQAEAVEHFLDEVESICAGCADLRVVLLPAEGTIPHLEEPPKEEQPEEPEPDRPAGLAFRVSREELYADAVDGADVAAPFYVLAALSAVVASVGLLRDNVAVIIGAMVIAPLFGPNMSLAVGTTLGDLDLTGRGLRALLAGVGIAAGVAAAIGLWLPVDASIPSLASRTVVSYADVTLALAAGAAGTFAFTAGRVRAVIGVMVAVALLPPLVAFGLLLGSWQPAEALGALLLAAANIICINLAAVAAFLLQGVRPRTWWEAKRARAATRRASLLWALLLAALVVILNLR